MPDFHKLWSFGSFGDFVVVVSYYHLMVFPRTSKVKLWFKSHLKFTPKGSILSSFVKRKASIIFLTSQIECLALLCDYYGF